MTIYQRPERLHPSELEKSWPAHFIDALCIPIEPNFYGPSHSEETRYAIGFWYI